MKNIINLENKTVLVTGASSGIGKAVCKEISKYGAKVIMLARREDKMCEIMSSLPGSGHACYKFDLANIEEIESLVKQIVSENGKLDGFVYSAGIGSTRTLNQTTYLELHKTMLVNYYAFVEFSRIYAKKKNNNGGSIVAISSLGSLTREKAKIAYSSSKAALDAAVRCMSAELKQKNIRVNSIQPGWVRTEMFDEYIGKLGDDAKNQFIKDKVIVESEDIASLAAFLLSNASKVISGTSIIANSGM